MFMQFEFWKAFGNFIMINSLSWSYGIVIKNIFPHKSLFDQEMDHSNSAETASKTLKNIELFDFFWVYVEPIYQDSSPCKFSWDHLILLKCWHLLIGIFLYDMVFVHQVFTDAGLSIRDRHTLLSWSSRIVSSSWYYWNKCHTVWSQIDSSPHALLISTDVLESLWASFVWFGLVSLFNSISTFVGYLMSMPSL